MEKLLHDPGARLFREKEIWKPHADNYESFAPLSVKKAYVWINLVYAVKMKSKHYDILFIPTTIVGAVFFL